MALKWGIVSAALISHDFCNAMETLENKSDHQVVAVAARDLSRAKEFAERFNIPKAYGNYLELAKDPNVEIAYIGTLNPQHFEVSMMMLEHGKHVLCEKPLCINEKQAQKLISFAREKKLFFMEGIWCRFFPAYQYARKQVESGALGEILSVDAQFGLENLVKVDRLSKKNLGGGTTLDMGVYTIQCCQWVFREPPKSIVTTGQLNEEGVDVHMESELRYGDNKVAHIKTSALHQLSNVGVIVGTKGKLTIKNHIFCPDTVIDVDGTEKHWPLPKARLHFNFPNSCGLRYEIEAVRKCIREGKTECETVSHNESITIARIQDEIRKQLGVKFPEDDQIFD